MVRAKANSNSPEIGLLREGATITVIRCEPDCAARDAWAIIESEGAVRLSLLRPEPGVVAPQPQAELLDYGRVGPLGIAIYKEANLRALVLSHRRMAREMAFRPDPALRARGWLERIEGGFVRAKQVTTLKPSALSGQLQPSLPLAFAIRDLAAVKTGGVSAERLHRYDRLPILDFVGMRVSTSRGSLPRKDVRIVQLQAAPPSVPAGAKWVHVDLEEQTLTAYEGEKPVFATLISSGKATAETETLPGLYRVEHKLVSSNMSGESKAPYSVDRVPHVQYFHKGDALHGAYWHDLFGRAASHGCINLSPADAAWLFDWAAPRLPEGWSAVEATEPGVETLWVSIVRKVFTQPLAKNDAAVPIRGSFFQPL